MAHGNAQQSPPPSPLTVNVIRMDCQLMWLNRDVENSSKKIHKNHFFLKKCCCFFDFIYICSLKSPYGFHTSEIITLMINKN